MCILCVVQKWSRRVATMLPWLVIPLIGLWALSQLLPPGFRFEVTSPRLACVLVLLVTLFWYEILMPQLSIWRTRRIARLRERKRFEALEMQKLRKMATRRCRNCSTPYRDQNPGGGRFMCSYCGHISKRPVLDIPGSAGLGITNSGIIGDLVSKSGRILNGKMWSENGWSCSQEWRIDNGTNWVPGSFAVKSSNWGGKNRGGGLSSSNDDRCLAEKSYSGAVVFAYNLLMSFFLSLRWLWRKIFRASSSSDDASSDADHRGMLTKKGENGLNFNESKGEKARRKAEERRQARLERELLEEEEKKQREEVARLVEERRRLRDENTVAEEKEHGKGSVPEHEKDSKRDADRKRKDKKKEKDKGSSKSNSDVEDLERRVGRETEKKREFDKKSETERRHQKTAVETGRFHSTESGHGGKVNSANNFNRASGGRYFDRVKGSFLSSSKAFNGAGFFGKGGQTSANVVPKTNSSNSSVDHVQTFANKREGMSELPPRTTPKKSWQQLFTRSPAVPSSSNTNIASMMNQQPQAVARGPQLPSQALPLNPSENQMHFGVSSPLSWSPYPNGSFSNNSVYSPAAESMSHRAGGPAHEYVSEEPELFGDPCYVPDMVSLLGPVSESLDNFPLDLGTGFVTDRELGKPYSLKNVSVSAEVTRPSPIESPMSRLRVVEERHASSSQFPSTPKTQDLHTSPLSESSKPHEPGTWQMWSSPPLGQDGLNLLGGPASWFLPVGQNKSNQEEIVHSSLHKNLISQFAKENQVFPGTVVSPQKVSFGYSQTGGGFNPCGPGLNDNYPWLQKAVFQASPTDGENHFSPLTPGEDISRNELAYGSPRRSATFHPFEPSPADRWSNKDQAVHGSGEGVGNSSLARPPIGGLFCTPDVQSLWSFN